MQHRGQGVLHLSGKKSPTFPRKSDWKNLLSVDCSINGQDVVCQCTYIVVCYAFALWEGCPAPK